jgi:hypothetical protein
MGRPDHLEAVRIEQRLLDTCIGRLRPHPSHPSQIERYLVNPLLSLADVGAYALAQVGLPAASLTLDRLGLLVDRRPRPLPDDITILAVASQRSPDALTDAGWRRTPYR